MIINTQWHVRLSLDSELGSLEFVDIIFPISLEIPKVTELFPFATLSLCWSSEPNFCPNVLLADRGYGVFILLLGQS